MAVYVDNMMAKFGRMIMSHMLADSDEELHAMADRIGVARKWHQKAGTYHSHYDIALSKRKLAIHFGAKEITRAELGAILRRKHEAAQVEIVAARIARKLKEKEDERVREVHVVLQASTTD
jgi:flavin-dependent dehydrogenase